MKLRFTEPAADDLANVLDYLAARSPAGARKVQDRIRTATDLILRFPEAGRTSRRAGMRAIVATPYPYRIFYTVDAEHVTIHAVRHSARDPKSMPTRRTD